MSGSPTDLEYGAFSDTPPWTIDPVTHPSAELEAHGGFAVADLDGDGHLDLLFTDAVDGPRFFLDAARRATSSTARSREFCERWSRCTSKLPCFRKPEFSGLTRAPSRR